MGEVILFFLLASVGLGHCSDDNSSVNVATRGRATQSSTFELKGSAKHAIDGSRNSDYNKNSCSKTVGGTNSWWRVDLLDTYEVSSVTITNRDQLPERINRAEIRIGNSLENDGNSNPRCAVISSIPAGGSTTFQCRGMQGRYVNVFLPGYKQYLTLCEVEVYATKLHSVGPSQTLELDLAVPVTENVALGKTAVLSSEYNSNRRGSKAVDGENNCQNAYSRTKTQTNPWWRVDLLQSYNITSITVVNIEDDNPEMIDGAEIRIGNSLENNGNNNPLCAVISSYPAWRVRMFQCRGMKGRYVNILLPGCDKHLALCEVEVNVGLDKENDMRVLTSSTIDSETRAQFLLRQQDEIVCPNHKNKDKTIQENASTGGVATQSSLWDKDGSASNAIDQDRTSMYTSGSCSHTKAEIDPWWRVDLKKNYNVTFVTVTNRGDCCSERISGAEIHVGHSLMNNGNSNPICAVIPYIPLGQTRTFPCGGMEGQYVNILLPGREKYLTLCEVEVHASNFKREYAPPTESPPTNPYLAWLWEPLRQLKHRLTLKGNVALMGRAVQSSRFTQLTSAENAIDGRLETDYLSGSCTQTRLQSDPWWRVDLMAIHKVSYITITNREDCCAWRLDGAQVLVGNSLLNNGNNNPVCVEITSIPAGESVTFQCNGMEGRYINIIRHGCFKILTVCEVEVYGESLEEALTYTQQESSESQMTNLGCTQACETQCPIENIPQNLASDGLATQSSEYDNLGSASNAIDRKRDPLYHSGSCSHTKAETNPWWRLDLLGIYYVTSVSITNRGDCCHTRITGAEIRIGNHLDGAKSLLCAVIPEMKEGEVREFSCGEMEGRYVTVVLPGKGKSLSLCEVEVHGGRTR